MSRANPEQLHHYYSRELDLDDALASKKARCCPVWNKRTKSICDWSIGRFRTDRILYMLEDLHFCKSVPLNPFTTVVIARLAWNIAKASFCSKHEPKAHIAEMKTRFDTIRRKALDCPVFYSPGQENIEESQSGDFGRMLTEDFGRMFSTVDFPPSTPPNAKRARDDENDIPRPPPVKRARHTREHVQHDDSIWQDLFRQCATDANALVPTGSNSSSTAPFDYANHFSAGANPITPPSMFTYNFSAGPKPVTTPPMLSCNGNNLVWSSESDQRAKDMMIQQLFPDDVDKPTSPSAAKLARVASRYSSPSKSMHSNQDLHQDWLDLLDPNKPFLPSHQPGLDLLDQHKPLSNGVQAQAPWLDGAFGESPILSEAQLSAVGGQEQVAREQLSAVGGQEQVAREQLSAVGGQEQVEVAPPGEWLAFQEVDLMAEFDMTEFDRMCGEYHRDVARPSSTTASIPSGTSDLELVQNDAGESLVSSKAQDQQVGQVQHAGQAQHDRQAQHDGQDQQVGQAQHDGQAQQVGQDQQDGQDQQVGQDPEGGVWSPPVGWVDFSQFLNENEVPEGCAEWEQFLNGQSGVEQSGSAE